jgi:hypothetical protein
MKATKTLNIDANLHTELKIRAVGAGWPLGEYVERVLQVGLSHPEELRQLLEAGTNPGSSPETT